MLGGQRDNFLINQGLANFQQALLTCLSTEPVNKILPRKLRLRSSIKMPLAALVSPCRTSVLSAAPPSCQRPHRLAMLILTELLSRQKRYSECQQTKVVNARLARGC